MQNIVPGSEPFYLPGGSTGCLLLHGFSAMPEEMRYLGDFLGANGFTVLGTRLAGHATHPKNLARTHWTDWLDNVEDGLSMISGFCTRRVLIGQSMGGAIALAAASRFEVNAVVALSTPYGGPTRKSITEHISNFVHPWIHKDVQRFPVDHTLYHRRERNYPAYPEFPVSIGRELNGLLNALVPALPNVAVPVLLMHSRDDRSVPFDCMQLIYDQLGTRHKQMVALDGMDHSLVRDPRRQVVFDFILHFLNELD